MKCCKTEAAVLFLGKELENVASLVLHFRDARTWQRAGNCCIFGTSFSGYLLVFGYFCCFLACDLALLQVLRCSQPTPSNSSVLPVLILFEYFGYLAQHLFQCYALPFDFLRVCCTWSVQFSQGGLWLCCHFLWYMAGPNL